MSVTRRYFRGNNSLLKDPFTSLLDSSGKKTILSQGYKSLDALYPYLERVYMYEDGRDVLKTVMKGDFPKVYLWWGVWAPRIQHFTPAYWTGKLMDSTHKFGLDYDENWEGKELFSIFKAGKNSLIIENKFKLDFTTSVGTVTDLDIVGGKYLGTAKGAWDSFKDNKLVGNLTVGTVYGNTAQQTQAFFDFINGREGDFLTANAGMSYIGVFGKDASKAQAQALEFKAFLTKNASRLGLRMNGTDIVNDPNNAVVLEGFFKALGQRKANNAFVDPFAHYYGGLQWVSAKLTGIQQFIFSKVGKFFAPAIRAKNAAIKAVSDFAGRIVGKILLKAGITTAIGAATGGIAAFLAPLLEKVLQATLSKIADVGKGLLRAVLKGDIVGEFNKMMDDAMKATEKAITCGCFVPVFLAFAVLIMMSNILVSISPVDRAKQVASAIVDTILPSRPEDLAPGDQTNCVFSTYIKTALSYNGWDDPPRTSSIWRHGSNDYWSPKDDATGTHGIKDCSYNIPYFAGNPARGPVNDTSSWCSVSGYSLKPYYGYALDVIPTTNRDEAWVYAPQLPNVSTWHVAGIKRIDLSGTGCYVILNGWDGGANHYSIFLLHLDCFSLPNILTFLIYPGDSIAKLYAYPLGKHVHIEMQVNNTYVKPEDWLCF